MKTLNHFFVTIFILVACNAQLNGQCNNNLAVNGSFTGPEGVDQTAPGWHKVITGSVPTPDINDEVGPLNTTPGYTWTGVPLASPDSGTWQNLFSWETIAQDFTLTQGTLYSISFDYATQGIHLPSIQFVGPCGVTVYLNNLALFTTSDDTSQYTWESIFYDFIAPQSSVTIALSPSVIDRYVGIDGFCLKQAYVGINDHSGPASQFVVYSDASTTEIRNRSGNLFHNAEIQIVDAFGKIVYSLKGCNEEIIKISNSGFASGMYVVSIKESQQVYGSVRFLVVH